MYKYLQGFYDTEVSLVLASQDRKNRFLYDYMKQVQHKENGFNES